MSILYNTRVSSYVTRLGSYLVPVQNSTKCERWEKTEDNFCSVTRNMYSKVGGREVCHDCVCLCVVIQPTAIYIVIIVLCHHKLWLLYITPMQYIFAVKISFSIAMRSAFICHHEPLLFIWNYFYVFILSEALRRHLFHRFITFVYNFIF